MTPGNIVFLNGTSSSGKTTLAKSLQSIMDEPYFHIDMDLLHQTWPAGFLKIGDGLNPDSADGYLGVFRDDVLVEVRIGPAGFRLLAGLYQAIAGWASAGNHLIIDDVIYHPRTLSAAVQALKDFPVLFVGIRCPLEVAEQREQARGDRARGGARTFHPLVHAHGIYDLEVETAQSSTLDCAQAIKAALAPDYPRTAFQRLAQILA